MVVTADEGERGTERPYRLESVAWTVDPVEREVARLALLTLLSHDVATLDEVVRDRLYEDVTRDLLVGRDPAGNMLVEDALRAVTPGKMAEAITAEIAQAAGIWLAAAVAMATINDVPVSVTDATTDATLLTAKPRRAPGRVAIDTIELGPGVVWKSYGQVVLAASLPETILIPATDGPLSKILSHPVLNRHHPVVTHVANKRGHARLHAGPTSHITDGIGRRGPSRAEWLAIISFVTTIVVSYLLRRLGA